jgi:ComF family protein
MGAGLSVGGLIIGDMLRSMVEGAPRVVRGLAQLLFPVRCLRCGRPAGRAICGPCLEGLPRLGPEVCRRCGRAVMASVARCRECRGRAFEFDSARQAVAFEGPVRAAVHRLKYRGEWSVAATLAGLMAQLLPGGVTVVTWVPCSARRLRERGFDHAELLATSLALAAGFAAVPLLVREREGPPQMSLPLAARRGNVEGALRARLPAPREVIVVDDVFTTGATASEAARALKTAGAERVTCLAVARTPWAAPRPQRRSYNQLGTPPGSVVAGPPSKAALSPCQSQAKGST